MIDIANVEELPEPVTEEVTTTTTTTTTEKEAPATTARTSGRDDAVSVGQIALGGRDGGSCLNFEFSHSSFL